MQPALQGVLNECVRTTFVTHPRLLFDVKGRDPGEFLHRTKRLKKHVLHRLVHPTLLGGLNECVRTALLAHRRPLCVVKGRHPAEFLHRTKRLKKHVLRRFVQL